MKNTVKKTPLSKVAVQFSNHSAAMPILLALSSCSWMPHWACHYYRLETATDFIAGNWHFSTADSVFALCIYGMLVVGGFASIAYTGMRRVYLLISGTGHLCIAAFQIYRLADGLPFVIFNYHWSDGAAICEIITVSLFGIFFIVTATLYKSPKNCMSQNN